MSWTDGLVALAVLGVFVYFIYARLVAKYPEFGDKVGSWFSPAYLDPPIKNTEREERQQIWTERAVNM